MDIFVIYFPQTNMYLSGNKSYPGRVLLAIEARFFNSSRNAKLSAKHLSRYGYYGPVEIHKIETKIISITKIEE